MAVGASAQYAHFFPQKTYKQMNFINQNTSKVDFWAGNGQEMLSFLTNTPMHLSYLRFKNRLIRQSLRYESKNKTEVKYYILKLIDEKTQVK